MKNNSPSFVPFETALLEGTFLKRYKRFFADVELSSGEVITAHCPNTGSMKGCKEPGMKALVSQSDNPKRKLKFTLEAVKPEKAWVGVNTSRPNRIVENWILSDSLPELSGYENLRREVKYGENSRIDLLLEDPEKGKCYIEIKNVTLKEKENPTAFFPDAVTERGTKHLNELKNVIKKEKNTRGVIFFLVHREDCQNFSPADEIDPVYGKTLREVMKKGVEALAYQAKVTPKGVALFRKLDICLP